MKTELLKILKEIEQQHDSKIVYVVQDRVAGNYIDQFATLEEAEKEVEQFENDDRREEVYEPNFYEIQEKIVEN